MTNLDHLNLLEYNKCVWKFVHKFKMKKKQRFFSVAKICKFGGNSKGIFVFDTFFPSLLNFKNSLEKKIDIEHK